MTNDRPAEQVMVAVRAAGLDPDKPLNEQRHRTGDLERQVAELSEQVKTLSEARAAPTDPHARERQFAENFRDALNENLTPGQGEEHDDAAQDQADSPRQAGRSAGNHVPRGALASRRPNWLT